MAYSKQMILMAAGMLISTSLLQGQPHYNAWFRTTLIYPLKNNLRIDTEIQHRRQNGFDNKVLLDKNLMYTVRSWVHYQRGKTVRLSVSPLAYFSHYRIIRKQTDERAAPGKEFRISAALEWQYRIAEKIYVVERSALEYRMFESSSSNVTRVRTRTGIRYQFTEKINLDLYNELLLNITGRSLHYFFDHNRVGMNVAYKMSSYFKMDAGYIYISRLPLAGGGLIKENNIFLNLSYTLRFRDRLRTD